MATLFTSIYGIFVPRSRDLATTRPWQADSEESSLKRCYVQPDPIFFQDLAIVFLAAVAGGVLARLAGQPLILGYVLGGIAIGPFTPGPTISESHTFDLFAEIGVILLMFSIGLEFSVKDLMRVKWVALVGGPLGILMAIGLTVVTGSLIGWSTTQSIVIGAVISIASTMVLARLLVDRGELRSKHGRVMIGIALVEDVAVVAMTVLMPALGEFDSGRLLVIGQALAESAADSCAGGILGRESHPADHDTRRQDPEPRTLPARHPGHQPWDRRRHADGRTLPRLGRLPGRPHYQRIRVWARNLGPAALAP